MKGRPTRHLGPPRNPGALRSVAEAMKALYRRRMQGQLRFPSQEYWEALLTICEEHADEFLRADGPLAFFKQIGLLNDLSLREKLIQAKLGSGGNAKQELSELRQLINGADEPDAKET